MIIKVNLSFYADLHGNDFLKVIQLLQLPEFLLKVTFLDKFFVKLFVSPKYTLNISHISLRKNVDNFHKSDVISTIQSCISQYVLIDSLLEKVIGSLQRSNF